MYQDRVVYGFRRTKEGHISPGSARLGGCDPQVLGEELARLRENVPHGLSPRFVVEAAEPEASPLHPVFIWDDEAAAKLFRDNQARALMKSVVVVAINDKPLSEPVSEFVNVIRRTPEGEVNVYEHITIAMRSPDLRDQVLRKALKEIEDWRQRYEDYSEFSSIVESIEATAQKMKPKAV